MISLLRKICSLLALVLLSARFAHAQAENEFNQVISAAVDNIEEVRTKESELRSAEALRQQSIYRFMPDLNLVGTYSEIGPDPQERYVDRTYGLKSTVNLFRFGGDLQNYRSADYNSSSLRYDLQNTRLKMEETLVVKALELISSHQETEIRKKIIEAQRAFKNVAEKRYNRGILSRQELDQVTIDFSIAEARLKDAVLTEFKNREAFRVLLNRNQGANDELPSKIAESWPWLSLLKKISPKKIQFNIENHPAWRQAQTRVQSSEYNSKSNFSKLWPSLDMSIGYDNAMGGLIADRWPAQWTGAITLTVPLFNRLENWAGYKVAHESEVRDRLTLDRATRELTSEWTTAETEFKAQLDSALTREQTLKISHTLYQDNLRRFQAGRTNANDLVKDQERLYDAELLVVQGWRAAHESYLKLCHATGQTLQTCQL